MTKGEFDEIRDKLYDHEEPVDSGLWPDIQESLRRRRIRRVFYRALSAAAAIAAIFFALTSVDRNRIRELECFAQLLSPIPAPVAVVENAPEREVLPEHQILQEGTAGTDQISGTGKILPERQSSASPAVQKTFVPTASVEVLQSSAEEGTACRLASVDGASWNAASQRTSAEESALAGGASSDEAAVAVPVKESDIRIAKAAETDTRMAQAYNMSVDEWDELLQLDQMEKGREKRYAMAFTGGLMPGSSASVAGSRIMAVSAADDAHQGYMVEQVSDTKYSLPVNLGMQLQFPVSEKLSLGVGVSYTMLRSRFDCLVNKVRYSGQQTLHYIGIPVNVYGTVAQRDRFMFYVNGGAMIEKGVKAKYKFSSYKDSYSNSTEMDGLQFSVNAGLGVEYRFSDYVGLYFEPNVIFFTNSDMQYCIRTDQPLQIKAELGCRFHF